MSNKEEKKHSVLQKLGLSILTIVIVAAIVFTTYYFTLNKEDSSYINELYKYKVEVDKSNAQVAEAIKNIDSLDLKSTAEINTIKSEISNESSALQDIQKEIEKLDPPSKYKVQYDTFANGIYLNRRIFMQTNLILKNTKSTSLKSAINALTDYISKTSAAYESSKLKKAYIKLPDGIIGMADKVNTYAFNIYNDYETKTQSLEQYNSYFKTMDDILTTFNSTKEDLNSYVNFIKSNTLTTDDVYAKIESKLSDITQLQTSYTSLAVPPKMGDRHNQFDAIINAYFNYCQDFKTALNQFEEAGNDTNAQSDVNSTFNDLSTKYKNISKSFTDYWNAYSNDKEKYSDINNL
jgi:hypothetical protein